MNINYNVMDSTEKAIYKMRSLYKKYGYSQFKMSKFEEYDLYVRNKDFLVSENIITFTDTDGKLMALKPDVTLSIIKNTDHIDGRVQKVFYDENVYRVSKGTNSFKEIMQVGLECIGDIDIYNIFETIMLAAKSLENISQDYVLDISNMDIISSIIDNLELDNKAKNELIKCIGEKNTHGISNICMSNNICPDIENKLKQIVSLYGNTDEILLKLKSLINSENERSVYELEQVVSLLHQAGISDKIRIDFSVISDTNYYNGFVFKGFINGISSWVLSGGQYDNLLKKMRINCSAIGFAVYLDLLEEIDFSKDTFDIDAVILYNAGCDFEKLNAEVTKIADTNSVMVTKDVPNDIKYKKLFKFNGNEVDEIESNA